MLYIQEQCLVEEEGAKFDRIKTYMGLTNADAIRAAQDHNAWRKLMRMGTADRNCSRIKKNNII